MNNIVRCEVVNHRKDRSLDLGIVDHMMDTAVSLDKTSTAVLVEMEIICRSGSLIASAWVRWLSLILFGGFVAKASTMPWRSMENQVATTTILRRSRVQVVRRLSLDPSFATAPNI
ncbi:hypothetical protein L208DRAFT_1408512 [Tricholoma matsutake]|nr:hypothetical protein L208DRAFT_1408512 [Tricholoma matsutake 945]